MSELEYGVTNESLAAIVLSMDLKETSRVVAVGSSGDVPFAFLRYTKEVIAIDKNPAQVKLIEERKEFLERDLRNKFFDTPQGSKT